MMSLNAESLKQTESEICENARKIDRAVFFEEEGLEAFLRLDWGIGADLEQTQEFLDKYCKLKERSISLS